MGHPAHGPMRTASQRQEGAVTGGETEKKQLQVPALMMLSRSQDILTEGMKIQPGVRMPAAAQCTLSAAA